MIDLHMHSTYSDGSLTPEQLVDHAVAAGLTAIALTDHDCTGGLGRLMAACAKSKLVGVTGVEISAEIKRGTLHMLGYFIEQGNAGLEAILARIREGREDRNGVILTKLNALGLALTWDEVASYAGEDVVGRPHFAQAMLAHGYVTTKDEAFEKYLAKGRPAYVDRFRLMPKESIAAIRDAGGVAVLAHPFTLELEKKALREAVAELRDVGLQGIEVHYSEHSPDQTRDYLELAMNLGLAVTGGTDFHGASNPEIRLGVGFGRLCVPDELLDKLAKRKEDRRP
jgi:3',5'-nucleoside bisphosphate phosphatase